MFPTQDNGNKRSSIKKLPMFSAERDLQKFLEVNFTESLKQMIRATVQIMVKEEMNSYRKDFDEKLHFNGNYTRNMLSSFGRVENIPIPRFRQDVSGFEPRTLDVFNQEKEKFAKLIGQMHLLGISQRKIKQLTKICFDVNVSKDKVGAIYKELAEKEEMNINGQKLNDDFNYLILDGIWEKTKGYGWDNNKSTLLCALGISPDGQRKILGFHLCRAEDTKGWKELLEQIKKRGLRGKNLELIVSDDNPAIKASCRIAYPDIPIQLCIVHKMRNVLGKTSYKNKAAIAEDLKIVFQSQSKDEATNKAKQTVKKWYMAERNAMESLRYDIEDCFTYFKFSPDLWSRIRTTNILEREFRELRRRMKVFDNTFQNEDSANRYANSIFTYLNNNYPLKQSLHTKA